MKATKPLLFLALLVSFRSLAQDSMPPVYLIKADTASIMIPDTCWQMLEDAEGKWAIDQVSQSPLAEKFHGKREIHSSTTAYWVRYRLKNKLAHEAHIYFESNYYPKSLDLYTKAEGSPWEHQKTGYFLPWSKRDGIKNRFRLPVRISLGQELLIYQRFEFDPRLGVPEYLFPAVGFTEKMMKNNYILNETAYFDNIRHGVLFGVCMLAALFSFFFFLTAREWVYFHASMIYFLVALFGFLRGLVGIFFRENESILSFYGQYFLVAPFLYFLVSTTRHSLETKRQYPGWDRFLVIVSILPFIWFVAQYFYVSLAKWGDFFSIVIFLAVGISCLPLIRKKNRTTRLLIAGVLFFAFFELIGPVAQALNISLPGWLLKHTLDVELICTFWIIGISSWLLFERYRNLQTKLSQEAFEKAQMAKEQEIERRLLIEQQKVELEKQVTQRTAELKGSLDDLKSTQAQLIQSEKMASLGELTAGIAHEIQNPLNFVNNFSEVNGELIEELKVEAEKGNIEEVKGIAKEIEFNSEKINHHGKRADAIVKGMLQHSRSSSGVKEPTDINALADEYLRLSYHGLRAKDKSFNATMKTDFDDSIGKVNIIPQDIGRVILNLINNAFYAVDEKKKHTSKGSVQSGYEPIVSLATEKNNGKVEISVKDNGNGIPQKIVDKIFQPFFTTKPTGQGTGLGLSLSYDIVKAHGGELKVETEKGEGSEFIIVLPIN